MQEKEKPTQPNQTKPIQQQNNNIKENEVQSRVNIPRREESPRIPIIIDEVWKHETCLMKTLFFERSILSWIVIVTKLLFSNKPQKFSSPNMAIQTIRLDMDIINNIITET